MREAQETLHTASRGVAPSSSSGVR